MTARAGGLGCLQQAMVEAFAAHAETGAAVSAAIGQLHEAAEHRAPVRALAHAVHRPRPELGERVAEAECPEARHRLGAEELPARLRPRERLAIDDRHREAGARELQRGRGTGGPRADHQHVGTLSIEVSGLAATGGHAVHSATRQEQEEDAPMTKPAPADAQFDREDWWQSDSRAFASLRSVSAYVLRALEEWLGTSWAGRTVIDLGCGGGLYAVPLARAGARVVGVDVARGALRAARRQLPAGWLAVAGDLAVPPVCAGRADVVLLTDVIEHVADPAQVVQQAAALLRHGGYLFVNTIARTWRSRWLAIRLAEGLGLVPRGTHRWEKFINPPELEAMATAAGLRLVAVRGQAPRVFATLWQGAIALRPSRSLAVSYSMLFTKEPR